MAGEVGRMPTGPSTGDSFGSGTGRTDSSSRERAQCRPLPPHGIVAPSCRRSLSGGTGTSRSPATPKCTWSSGPRHHARFHLTLSFRCTSARLALFASELLLRATFVASDLGSVARTEGVGPVPAIVGPAQVRDGRERATADRASECAVAERGVVLDGVRGQRSCEGRFMIHVRRLTNPWVVILIDPIVH
jgi:hypothetical protein